FAMGPKGLTFQPFSVTTLNCQETNNANVTVRIIDMAFSVSGAVVLEVIEEDSSIYDTTAPLGTPVTQLDPGGFDPNAKIAVTGLASADATVTGTDGTSSVGFNVTWDDPGAWVQETQVQFKVSTDAAWSAVPAARVDVQQAIIVPTEPNTLYDIRARHITRFGVVGDFASIQDTAPIPAVGLPLSLTATGVFEGITLDWTNPLQATFELIEIHAGDDNVRGNAVIIAEVAGPPFTEILQENPRTRFYWIRARNAVGELSAFEPDTSTTTATATPRVPGTNIIVDPDFDKSTSLTAPGFWGVNVKQGTGPSQTGAINFITGGGANSSNAVDMIFSGGSGSAVTELVGLRRHRVNFGGFQARVRYKTIGAAGGVHKLRILASGFDVETGGSIISTVGTSITDIPNNTAGFVEFNLILEIPDTPTAQYWRFGLDLTLGSSLDTFRLDSFFIHPVVEIFGTQVISGDLQPGLVPLALAADSTNVLQGDGTWVANSGAALDDLTDVDLTGAIDNDLLVRSGGDWIDTAGLLTWDTVKFQADGTLSLLERASAPADTTAYGQFWVRDDQFPMFTNELGVDADLLAPYYRRSVAEIANGKTPIDFTKLWGDILRFDAKIDGTTDDTTAWNDAIDSGHPAFCDAMGTSNIEGMISMDGFKGLRTNAGLNMERQSGLSTLPIIRMYGNQNIWEANGVTVRQDLYVHLDGIIHIGPDTNEVELGPTDLQSNGNAITGHVKLVGAVKTIAQDGSMGIYVHSIGRKIFAIRNTTYDTYIESANIVNCDVDMELSTDANRGAFGRVALFQWKEAAIEFNASYGNQFFGLALESPLAVSATRRYALHFDSQNSGREADTSPSYTGNGTTDLDFVDGGGGNDSIVRVAGSWITDGFLNGDTITVAGSISNDGQYTVNSAPTATTLTVATASLTTESNVAATVSTRVYSITEAFANKLNLYAELPNDAPGGKVVSLFTYDPVTTVGGHNYMSGPMDNLIAGFGIDGSTSRAGVGTNIIDGTDLYVDYNRIFKIQDFQFRPLDDGSGGILLLGENTAIIGGRITGMAESRNYQVFSVDNVGPTTGTLKIKLTWYSKETANSASVTGEAHWNCQVEGSAANAPVRYHFNQDGGGELITMTPVVQSAAGTEANTGKYTVSINTHDIPGVGNGFCGWYAELGDANLFGTSALDWGKAIKILATDSAGATGNDVIVGYWDLETTSFTLRVNDKKNITATSAVTATLPGSLQVGDEIQVHNASTSTATVSIDPASHSIKGPGGTVTPADTMTIAPGDTAHLVCVSTGAQQTAAVMEVV
ncbi:hypothetical protein LCGC14_1304280, partial [marine sediment metagenome]